MKRIDEQNIFLQNENGNQIHLDSDKIMKLFLSIIEIRFISSYFWRNSSHNIADI